LTEKLLKAINKDGKIHCIPASIKGKYIIRFTITSPLTNAEDIHHDWSIIQTVASTILRPPVSLSTRARGNSFASLHNHSHMALVLSNILHDSSLVDKGFTAWLTQFINRNHKITCSLRHSVLESATETITRQRRKGFDDRPTMNKHMSVDESLFSDLQNKSLLPVIAKSRPISNNTSLDSHIGKTVEKNDANSVSQTESSNNELALTRDNDNMDHQIPISKTDKQ